MACTDRAARRNEMQDTIKMLCVLLAGCTAEANTPTEVSPLAREKPSFELEASKLIIEHNSTDRDTGFQGFVDGEPWKQLEIRDPDGKLILSMQPRSDLREL